MALPRPSVPARRALRRLLALSSLLCVPLAAPAAASAAHDGRERAVVKRINAVRADAGLRPLALRASVSRIADRHSLRLGRAGVLSHQLGGEASPAQRLRKLSGTSGEVLYAAGRGARSSTIVRAWMDSPGHRAVLLSPRFKAAGIGIRHGAGGLYVTVDVVGR